MPGHNKKPSYGLKINIIFPNHFKNRPVIFKKIVKEKRPITEIKDDSLDTHLVSMLFCHFAKSTSVQDISMDFVAQQTTSII